jgi:hypothetical protein
VTCKQITDLLRSSQRLGDDEVSKLRASDSTFRSWYDSQRQDWKPSGMKQQVVNDLSDSLGGQPGFDNTRTHTRAINGELVDYTEAQEKANILLTDWTKTTYHDAASASTQRAARLAFNLDDARQVSAASDAAVDQAARNLGDITLDEKARLLRAQYDATQKLLAKQGVGDYLTLYRGVNLSPYDTPPSLKPLAVGESGTVQMKSNPLSSWTTSPGIASQFSIGGTKAAGNNAFILKAVVPRSRVLATASSGIGSLGESEVVVLDTPGEIDAIKVRDSKDTYDENLIGPEDERVRNFLK